MLSCQYLSVLSPPSLLNALQECAQTLLLIGFGVVSICARQFNVEVRNELVLPLFVIALFLNKIRASVAKVALELANLARHAISLKAQ